MKLNDLVIIGVAATTVVSCAPSKKEYTSYELYPVRTGSLTEMKYSPDATQFTLWSPTADEVRLMLYDAGDGGHAYETVVMSPAENGTWTQGRRIKLNYPSTACLSSPHSIPLSVVLD